MGRIKKFALSVSLLFLSSPLWAPVTSKLNIVETDGSPSTFPYKLKVTAGSLTDNGDGTATLATGSAGGGGSSSLAIDLETIRISSPTTDVRFSSNGFIVSLQDTSTAYVSLNPNATYFIQNTLTPSTTTQFFSVQGGTVTKSLFIGTGSKLYYGTASPSYNLNFVGDANSSSILSYFEHFGTAVEVFGTGNYPSIEIANNTNGSNAHAISASKLGPGNGSAAGYFSVNTSSALIAHASTGLALFSEATGGGVALETGAGSVKLGTLTPSRCVETDSNNLLVSASGVCGSGGSGSYMVATSTGSTAGFIGTPVSSSTASTVILFDSSTFIGQGLSGQTTGYYTLNSSSVTLYGTKIPPSGLPSTIQYTTTPITYSQLPSDVVTSTNTPKFSLSIATGSTAGFIGPATSSSTSTTILLLDSATFVMNLFPGTTVFTQLNTSSVTLYGPKIPASGLPSTIGYTTNTFTNLPSTVLYSTNTVTNLPSTVGYTTNTFTNLPSTILYTSSTITSTRTYVFDAASLHALETNFAVLESTSYVNVKYFVRAFDDTTQEYANGFFTVPSNLNTSGVITIRLIGRPKTAAASVNTAWLLEHLPLTDSESTGGTYLHSNSGNLSVDSITGDLDQLSWSMSVTSSTWAANDALFFRLSRNPGAASDLTGDYYLKGFALDVPTN